MADRQDPSLPDGAAAGMADDALAQAMVWLLRHHGQQRSVASLFEGQLIDGQVGPDQALRALHEAGWNAGLVQRPIGEFNELLLPVVLLLKNGDAAILVARQAQAGGPTLCTVVMPGPDAQALSATEAELAAEYAGMAIVATPRPQAPPRSSSAAHDAAALHDPATHWLWGTVRRFTPYYRAALLAALLSNTLMLVTG
ncbi:MAG: protease/lipase ABC transporter permease/ATP-binding protein, partial [Burkholderiales bacterium PBB5]